MLYCITSVFSASFFRSDPRIRIEANLKNLPLACYYYHRPLLFTTISLNLVPVSPTMIQPLIINTLCLVDYLFDAIFKRIWNIRRKANLQQDTNLKNHKSAEKSYPDLCTWILQSSQSGLAYTFDALTLKKCIMGINLILSLQNQNFDVTIYHTMIFLIFSTLWNIIHSSQM